MQLDVAECRDRLALACQWLGNIAQVRAESDVTAAMRGRHAHPAWVGAIRGEYRVSTAEWSFFCPIWHTGQAVRALVAADEVLGGGWLDAATRGADFILANQWADGPDRGLILGFEDHGDKVNISAILECLDGLLVLSQRTGLPRYREAALAAVDWIQRKAVIAETGLVLDLYAPATASFVPNAYRTEGRPLAEDAIFLKAHQLTGRADHLRTAVAIANRLLADEGPPGNWVKYSPCDPATGATHPRHAYWWGRPMLALYQHTGDERYRDAFSRSCEWYVRALRRDGGLIRNTYTDFTSDSFGHATSGVGGAALMFLDAMAALGRADLAAHLERALSYCMMMQFTRPRDPNLVGCVLEKVLPPDGTDASPYQIRDLGTIFFAQAMAQYLTFRR